MQHNTVHTVCSCISIFFDTLICPELLIKRMNSSKVGLQTSPGLPCWDAVAWWKNWNCKRSSTVCFDRLALGSCRCTVLSLHTRIVFNAVSLLDAWEHQHPILEIDLQRLGLVCLWISAKVRAFVTSALFNRSMFVSTTRPWHRVVCLLTTV